MINLDDVRDAIKGLERAARLGHSGAMITLSSWDRFAKCSCGGSRATVAWLRSVRGDRMAGLLEFAARFGTEERCIEHLAELRWPSGFVCAGCGGRQAWRLKARPRVYECTACHRQESVTAGTVLHRTRTNLSKWFVAAYLMGRDKRGVSAKFLQGELAVAYQTAWTMAHKLRHGLSEDSARPLGGLLEADETFIGGRGDPTSRGRSTANPDKSLVVAAVEKVPAPHNQNGKSGHAVKRQHGF